MVPPLYEEVHPLCITAAEEDARPILTLSCCGSSRAELAATSEGTEQSVVLQTKVCNCFAGMGFCKQVVMLYS